MGIKADFNFEDILKNQDAFLRNVETVLFDVLDRTLVEITNLAKSTNTYTDRTGNLRSSIGYILLKDGEIVKSNFASAGKGDESGNNGVKTGKELAVEIGKNYSSGYVCVYVAGMEYAAYVESKGFDVVSGSWMQFDSVFQQNAKFLQEATGLNFTRL